MRKTLPSFELLDELIRSGNSSAAQEKILAIKKGELQRKECLAVASLARRAGLPDLSIKLLRPIIYPVRNLCDPSSEAERVEYAAALIRIGIHQESRYLLETVSPSQAPMALFFGALALLKEWRYREAVPLLAHYIELENDFYRRLDGLLNLALSRLWLRQYDEAEGLLHLILENSKTSQFSYHAANAYRLLGGLEFFRENWALARVHLKKAESFYTDKSKIELFFVRKWLLLTDYYEKGQADFEEVRLEAMNRNHWETLRDIDFHIARKTKDQPFLEKLYYGTPFESFRERVVENFILAPNQNVYPWRLGPEASKIAPPVEIEFPKGKLLDRLFRALASDFYSPQSTVALFQRLFPGERYRPENSALRVRQVMNRLRVELSKEKSSIVVEFDKAGYRLSAKKPLYLLLPVEGIHRYSGAEDYRLQALQEAFPSFFSAKEAMILLSLSKTAAQNVISLGIERNQIEKSGGGPNTRYCFKTSKVGREVA